MYRKRREKRFLFIMLVLFVFGGCKSETDQTGMQIAQVEEEKIVLTVGLLGTEQIQYENYCQYLEERVAVYNATSDVCQVQLVRYGEIGETDALTLLNTELAAGTGPDILFLDGMPYETLAAQGILVNLYTFLDSDTSPLKREELFEGPLKAMEYDGELYCISGQYALQVNYGLRSVFDTGPVDVKRLFACWDTMPDTDCLFVENDIRGSGSALALILYSLDTSEYLDLAGQSCNFTDAGFVEILEQCGALPDTFEETPLRRQYGAFCAPGVQVKEKEALVGRAVISSPEIYAELRARLGEEFCILGEIGTPVITTTCRLRLPLAITAQSENKEAAWDFIVSTLQTYGTVGDFKEELPLVKANLERYVSRQGYTTGWGLLDMGDTEGAEPFLQIPLSSDYPGGEPGSTFFTQAVYAELLALIDTATIGVVGEYSWKWNLYRDVENIVEEEAGAYFAGDTSASAAAERIQSRVHVLLAERR